MDCKSQITQITNQVIDIFATLVQSGPKHARRGIIYSPFNFLGDANSAEDINAII